jgi:signal transduction histidine kinase
MNYMMINYGKALLTGLAFLVPGTRGMAQENPADSVHYWLDKSIQGQKVDTATFQKGIGKLNRLSLTDSLLRVFEEKARRFPAGSEDYWRYRILNSLLGNLSTFDMEKAISFGRRIFAETEKLNGPHAHYIRSSFLRQLRLPYRNSGRIREGFEFFTGKLKAYREKNDSAGLADCHYVLGGFYRTIGLLDQAIYHSKKGQQYCDSVHGTGSSFGSFNYPNGRFNYFNGGLITGLYQLQKEEYGPAIQNFRKVLRLFMGGETTLGYNNAGSLMAQAKMNLEEMDSVVYYVTISLEGAKNNSADFKVFPLQVLAEFYTRGGNTHAADSVLDICDSLIRKNQLPVSAPAGIIDPEYYRALVRAKLNQLPEAIAYLKKDILRLNNNRLYILRDLRLMTQWYRQLNQPALEAETYRQFIGLQDSVLADQAQFRSLSFEAEQEMGAKEMSINRLQSANKISALTRNFSIGMAVLLLLLAAGLYQRFRFKHRANQALESALANLQATQAQLLQSEKMASLGELTAGIAHEIQNPLNFVNNFSEVNKELLGELKEEIKKGNMDEVNAIADDVISNEEKINHHGKRADAIVKGMLQHSRSSSGVKEPTDINELADEYLRLAYHGLRAKDKSFNATMITEYDESIGNINIIPQDIGRVVLNLITNAFYAVADKKRQLPDGRLPQGELYEPTVSVTTKKVMDQVEIHVKDNGNGIPPNVVDKIFQPFFTTKPTGQGTGLGLSLSYDIVKVHGGEIKVHTKEMEGSEFVIKLPV